jgi:hypothetical protein
MRRIQLVLAALAIVVTSLAAFSGSAIADDLDCRDAKGDLIRCDGDLYAPYGYYNDYRGYDNFFDHDNFFDYGNYYNDEDLEDAYEDYVDEVEDRLEDYDEGSYSGFNNYW